MAILQHPSPYVNPVSVYWFFALDLSYPPCHVQDVECYKLGEISACNGYYRVLFWFHFAPFLDKVQRDQPLDEEPLLCTFQCAVCMEPLRARCGTRTIGVTYSRDCLRLTRQSDFLLIEPFRHHIRRIFGYKCLLTMCLEVCMNAICTLTASPAWWTERCCRSELIWYGPTIKTRAGVTTFANRKPVSTSGKFGWSSSATGFKLTLQVDAKKFRLQAHPVLVIIRWLSYMSPWSYQLSNCFLTDGFWSGNLVPSEYSRVLEMHLIYKSNQSAPRANIEICEQW